MYDVANGCVNDTGSTITFPSGTTLKVSEGGSTAGQIQQVVDAYYQLGAVYWYFKNNFGRDSYDNAGGMMSGYVRTKFQSESCNGGNNAFWYNRMMVMGAGGTDFHDLSQSRDVTFHEIGHGVTEYTSGLIYQKEPGGLNEASSDIWGAAIEAWTNSFSGDPSASTPINYTPNANTWKVGEGLSVSNGDPLRWMNDPSLDGYSADEYSDYTSRWGTCTPSNSNDQVRRPRFERYRQPRVLSDVAGRHASARCDDGQRDGDRHHQGREIRLRDAFVGPAGAARPRSARSAMRCRPAPAPIRPTAVSAMKCAFRRLGRRSK